MSIPRPVLTVAAAVFAALLVATPGAAQSARLSSDFTRAVPVAPVELTRNATVSDSVVAPVGPTTQSSIAGVRVESATAATAAPAVAAARVGRNPALMIVGGAALIVGAVIGGDAGTIVMVGGAVVGLIGLWNYLQ